MSKERASFPDEPLRRVLQEPKPAIENQDGKNAFAQEKDGQLYFWDNILSFPDNWSKPNEQVPLFPKWVWETYNVDEVEQLKLPKGKIPEDYVQLNQEHWKKAKRGFISRPFEIPLNNFLSNRLVGTFESYGLVDSTKPIIVGSVFLDNPDTPSSKFVYAERYPDNIKEEDKKNWSIGIGRITEYATNYATREFFIRNMDFPGGASIAEIYGKFVDFFTYRFVLGGTYIRMGMVEERAMLNGKDYKGALFQALFHHDFEPINELIADTKDMSGCSNIHGMAIQIGKNRFKKPDIGKWLDKLDGRKENNSKAVGLRNCITSVLAAGVFRNPGVIEISVALIPFLAATNIIVNEINADINNQGFLIHPSHMSILQMADLLIPNYVPLIAEGLIVPEAVACAIIPFVAVHEGYHQLSSNMEYMGLIPAKIINKEVTPYKSRLEPEQ